MTALPTVRRRMLGSELRSIREELGLTVNEMAERLGWPQSKVSRVETGRSGIRPHEVEATLDAYQVTATERREALATLAREVRQRMWWTPYSDVITQRYAEYIAFEAEACSMRSFAATLIPGLFQTAEYTRAISATLQPESPPHEIDALVNVRLARQNAALRRSDPLHVWAVLDEATLRRQIGGPKAMASQLHHLLTVSDEPHVTIQVLPFGTGAHSGLLGPFVILQFPLRSDLDVVHTESYVSNLHFERDNELATYSKLFQQLCAAALDVAASRDHIGLVIKDLK